MIRAARWSFLTFSFILWQPNPRVSRLCYNSAGDNLPTLKAWTNIRMINVIATIELKPDSRTQFLEIFNGLVPEVLAEQGCIEYFPAIDADANLDRQATDENAVTVIEKWESLEALHTHLNAPHMVSFRESAGQMIQSMTLKVLEKA